MKILYTLVFALMFSLGLQAQSIQLPTYYAGQYHLDTVYTYYGPLPFAGIGSVTYGGNMGPNFITGVDFKVVVDSTNQGASPVHAAFRDSMGMMVPTYAGDTLPVPVYFQLMAGEIGFHVIIEGTPTISGEVYLCDLMYAFTTGNDWGMAILDNSPDTCSVDFFNGFWSSEQAISATAYPNPFHSSTTIEFKRQSALQPQLMLFDAIGQEVKADHTISNDKIRIERKDLPSGLYFFQISESGKVAAFGELIIE